MLFFSIPLNHLFHFRAGLQPLAAPCNLERRAQPSPGILVEQGVMLDDDQGVAGLFKNGHGHELKDCESSADLCPDHRPLLRCSREITKEAKIRVLQTQRQEDGGYES